MEETLDAAIDRLFGKPGSAAPPPRGPTPARPRRRPRPRPRRSSVQGPAGDADRKALAAEALAHYERALAAQREGNWALYGGGEKEGGGGKEETGGGPGETNLSGGASGRTTGDVREP